MREGEAWAWSQLRCFCAHRRMRSQLTRQALKGVQDAVSYRAASRSQYGCEALILEKR